MPMIRSNPKSSMNTPLVTLANGAQAEVITGTYQDNKNNRVLGRVGKTYQRYIIRKGPKK